MKVIESNMIDAIRNEKNWQSGGTEVTVSDAGHIQVLLHGSPIVKIEKTGNKTSVFASLAGWNTQTTRSRINAVCEYYGVPRIHNVKREPVRDGEVMDVRAWFRVL